jgi:Holliday junction DNA helicase RuvB
MSTPKRSLTGFKRIIGLNEIKERANVCVGSCKRRSAPFPHTLLLGPGGLGKTEFARALSEELDCYFHEVEAISFGTRKQLIDQLVLANERCQNRKLMFFLDEVHRLSPALQEACYYPMKEWRITTKDGDIHFKPFSFVAATTLPNKLDKQSFMARFTNVWYFQKYDLLDMNIIVSSLLSAEKLIFSTEVVNEITDRTMGVPRIAKTIVTLVRDQCCSQGSNVIDINALNNVFDREGIFPLGLRDEHVEYLKALYVVGGGPRGIRWLAGVIGQHEEVIEERVEPDLLSLRLLDGTKEGRRLTKSGQNYVKSLSSVQPVLTSVDGPEAENLKFPG